MALPTSYLVTTKNLEGFLNALTAAKAPDHFSSGFLVNLEFKSSNDRLFIGLLKSLGFIDANGVPTERYYRFLDQGESRRILAEAIKEAYSDLFDINSSANEWSVKDVKNKLRTLTRGTKTEGVLGLMAMTFVALCKYADWSSLQSPKKDDAQPTHDIAPVIMEPVPAPDAATLSTPKPSSHPHEYHYNIQIHLPDSRDPAVYDVLFQALKKHLD